MNELALFAGAGGGILGGHLLGWRTVCAVERDAYAAQVLAQRQTDGALPAFPIWSDVRSFDGRRWRGLIDAISGGFPCQDISAAGQGAGIEGERSGEWRQMARIIGEVRPEFAYMENSPLLVRRGLAVVLGDLAALGYDARWCVVGAADLGAPHQRDRIWIVAHTDRQPWDEGWPGYSAQEPGGRNADRGSQRSALADTESQRLAEAWQLRRGEPAQWSAGSCEEIPYPTGLRLEAKRLTAGPGSPLAGIGRSGAAVADSSGRRHRPPQDLLCAGRKSFEYGGWWDAEPDVGRVANGVAARVERLKAIGNGQVPAVAAAAFLELAGEWL